MLVTRVARGRFLPCTRFPIKLLKIVQSFKDRTMNFDSNTFKKVFLIKKCLKVEEKTFFDQKNVFSPKIPPNFVDHGKHPPPKKCESYTFFL